MVRIRLVENQSEGVPLILSAGEAVALNQTSLVQVVPACEGGWQLFPCLNKVGAITKPSQ